MRRFFGTVDDVMVGIFMFINDWALWIVLLGCLLSYAFA